jgi:hypothetical protein
MRMDVGQKLAGQVQPSVSVNGGIRHGMNLSLREAGGAGGDG